MAYDLTLTSPVYNASGKYGQSLSSGNGTTTDVFLGLTNVTLEAWCKTTATGSVLAVCGTGGSPWIGMGADGKARATWGPNDYNILSTVTINDGAWHHLAFCIASTTTGAAFYVDGVLAGTHAGLASFAGGDFGVRFLGKVGFYWAGEVDDVAVSSVVKYTADFTPGPISDAQPTLRAVWHLDGNGLNSAGAVAAATAITMSGPTTGVVGTASTAFNIAANGTITGTVVVTPSDGGAGGTFNPTTVSISSATPTGTVAYTAASTGAKTISATNNGALTDPATITYTASASDTTAPAFSSAQVANASPSIILVTMNEALAASVPPNSAFTPSGGRTVTGVSIAGAVASVTVNTPYVNGDVITIAYTQPAADPRLQDAIGNPTATFAAQPVTNNVAALPVTFPVTDSNIFFSPYNWYSDGAGSMQANNVKASSTYAWSNMRGAYLKFRATVSAAGTIALSVDCASLAAVNAAGCPQLSWSVAGGDWQTLLLATGTTSVSIATALAAGTYDVFVGFRGVYITQDGDIAQNYTTPNNRAQITGIVLSAGGTLSTPALKSKRMIAYGDSITEGDLSSGSGGRNASSQDAFLTYGWLLASALDAEVGIVAFYGQKWSWFDTSWSNYASAKSRLVGGLLTPAPDYITVNYGENDNDPGPSSATVTTTLAAVSAAAPSAKLVQLIPFSGKSRVNLTAATLPQNGYRIDLAPPEMLYGKRVWSQDGQHPNARGHANLSALLSNKVIALPVAGLVTRTVSITLGLDANTAAANLTGAKVAFYDEPTPDLYTTPRFQTAAETADAAGVLTFTCGSTLPVGGTGGFVVQFADGKHYNGQVVVS